jgi:hypothetical protein
MPFRAIANTEFDREPIGLSVNPRIENLSDWRSIFHTYDWQDANNKGFCLGPVTAAGSENYRLLIIDTVRSIKVTPQNGSGELWGYGTRMLVTVNQARSVTPSLLSAIAVAAQTGC